MNRRGPDAACAGDRGGEQRQNTGGESTSNPDLGAHLARPCAKMYDHHQRQPRQEGTGLYRVPSPVAAPVKNQVGPQAAQADAQRGHQEPRTSEVEHARP